jgi:hypothetical protein
MKIGDEVEFVRGKRTGQVWIVEGFHSAEQVMVKPTVSSRVLLLADIDNLKVVGEAK